MAGKEYIINNKELTLYTIGELASLLDRQRQTIRKWEKQGIIPQAIYRSGANRRLYSKNQINSIVDTVNEYKLTQGQPIPEEFKTVVRKRFVEASKMDFEEPVTN